MVINDASPLGGFQLFYEDLPSIEAAKRIRRRRPKVTVQA
jgi:hypothetical protein